MKTYFNAIQKQFAYYKLIGEKAMNQLDEKQLFWQFNEESNSMAVMVNHLAGNMLSRWTNFLTEDGEKDWRNRDTEFEAVLKTKNDVLKRWEEGWKCLFDSLNQLTDKDLTTIVYIRNQGHTVLEAINRQLAHYAYHVGQMIYLAKMQKDKDWESLSIPKGTSESYNKEKFDKEKSDEHFTDEFLK